jgi:hypothetical protein
VCFSRFTKQFDADTQSQRDIQRGQVEKKRSMFQDAMKNAAEMDRVKLHSKRVENK